MIKIWGSKHQRERKDESFSPISYFTFPYTSNGITLSLGGLELHFEFISILRRGFILHGLEEVKDSDHELSALSIFAVQVV